MQKNISILLLLGVAVLSNLEAASRVGGQAEIVYETVSGGSPAVSTNGVYRLESTIGQNGFTQITTNGSIRVLNGFQKGESGNLLFPTRIQEIRTETNTAAIVFNVMKSNTYTVVYKDVEDGGLFADVSTWTNQVVAPFVATGGLGSVVTVYNDLTTVTNQARYYRIKSQ